MASSEERANLQRYVDLFNDRNWDGLRALLGDEAQLDLVTRVRQRVVVAKYYDRYANILENEDIRAESGLVDGVPAIAMYRPALSQHPAYFLLLQWSHGKVAEIRDYYYVPYIARGARFSR
jgi:RNA polymerase sigma-70 factor (ECF subfamily)